MSQKAINYGGCAYPITMDFTGPSTNPLTGRPIAANHTDRHIDLWLTKRDYFAGLAMQGFISSGEADRILAETDQDWPEAIAGNAYAMADAMIRAREA